MSALSFRRPDLLMVAPITSSPGPFSAGTLSPVIIDSSTADLPSMTTASTGIFSPGLTRSSSPTLTCSTGTSASEPSGSILWAMVGWRSTSFLTAAEALLFVACSRNRPASTRVIMTAAVSK